jgi:hypothetical protein
MQTIVGGLSTEFIQRSNFNYWKPSLTQTKQDDEPDCGKWHLGDKDSIDWSAFLTDCCPLRYRQRR